ncbi:diacylglycerol kinase [Roseateles sp. So40a]|uniref:diacylglycerol kinase n=1 Tax=Roseateles TaxID=93681 RepID=UPI000B4D45CA|nr:diacylglycerol kinase [Roseateles noduli]RZI62484.1 MAG: diacylglycerol kinase [Rubrivivax sp.]
MNPHKGRTGLDRLVHAFGYSLQGLRAAFVGESAFRQEVAVAIVLMPLALWLGGNGVERALLISSIWLVLIVELLNSALEAAIDRISFDRHELSKRAKDMGSAAVLLAIALAATVWAAVLASRWL